MVPNIHTVIHYQMVLDQVGIKLTEFRSAYELITAIVDAMQGLSVLTPCLFHMSMFCFSF